MKYKNLSRLIHNSTKGFTLIELLIVIAIIGILSSLGLSAYTQVQARARDSQRKTDLQQIRIALEVYRSDNQGYPLTAEYVLINCKTPISFNNNTYMQSLPCDPRGPTTLKYFYSSLDGSSYDLISCLENSSDKDATSVSGAYPAGCDEGGGQTWLNGFGYVTKSP